MTTWTLTMKSSFLVVTSPRANYKGTVPSPWKFCSLQVCHCRASKMSFCEPIHGHCPIVGGHKNANLIAEYDVNRLQCSVYAWIYAIPLPILSVDGKTACNNLYFKDGAKASCPIRRGQQYLYKNKIEIKSTYPKVCPKCGSA